MRKTIQFIVAVAVLAVNSTAAAVEPRLGIIEAYSQADEPVAARIPIRGVDPSALELYEADLAPHRLFRRAGIERQVELAQLEFEIVTVGEGAPYIAVTSDTPVETSLLDFLIRVRWPEGEVVREYTLLLERPTTVAPVPAPRQGRAAAGADGDSSPSERRPTAYGPVESGDTLWSIAARYRPDDSVTIAQTMLAIKELNPHAFAADNVNDLLSGWWLKLPTRAEIEAISPRQAQATYERHLQAWVPPAERGAVVEQLAPDAAVPSAASPPNAAETDAQPRLRIVAPDDEAADDLIALLDADLQPTESNLRRLQGALGALREERESLRAERESLQARVDDLQERVDALERLIDLRMEGVLPPPEDEASDPQVPVPELDPPAEEAPQPSPEPQPRPEPEPEPAPAPEPAVAEEEDEDEAAPWWRGGWPDFAALDVDGDGLSAADLWNDETVRRQLMALTGATLVLLAGLVAWLGRRRAQRSAAQRRDKLQLDPEGFDFDHEPSKQSRIDPLELAEDHIAESELEDARSVLERGILREPQRADLRLKLLDVLARLNQHPPFMEEAQALYERTRDDRDPVWQTALAIGRRFAPQEPLFGGEERSPQASDGGSDDVAAEEFDEPQDDLDTKPDLETLDLGLEEEEAAADGEDDDFNRRLDEAFGDDSPAAEPEPEPEPEAVMEKDPQESAAAQDAADDLFGGDREDTDEDDGLEEMDLDSLLSEEDEGGDETPPDGSEEAEEAQPEPEEERPLAAGEGDESDTKLDLARAYIDLGDEAGARELLEEVIEEGSERQRESARAILREFGG